MEQEITLIMPTEAIQPDSSPSAVTVLMIGR